MCLPSRVKRKQKGHEVVSKLQTQQKLRDMFRGEMAHAEKGKGMGTRGSELDGVLKP